MIAYSLMKAFLFTMHCGHNLVDTFSTANFIPARAEAERRCPGWSLDCRKSACNIIRMIRDIVLEAEHLKDGRQPFRIGLCCGICLPLCSGLRVLQRRHD